MIVVERRHQLRSVRRVVEHAQAVGGRGEESRSVRRLRRFTHTWHGAIMGVDPYSVNDSGSGDDDTDLPAAPRVYLREEPA